MIWKWPISNYYLLRFRGPCGGSISEVDLEIVKELPWETCRDVVSNVLFVYGSASEEAQGATGGDGGRGGRPGWWMDATCQHRPQDNLHLQPQCHRGSGWGNRSSLNLVDSRETTMYCYALNKLRLVSLLSALRVWCKCECLLITFLW